MKCFSMPPSQVSLSGGADRMLAQWLSGNRRSQISVSTICQALNLAFYLHFLVKSSPQPCKSGQCKYLAHYYMTRK